MEVLYFLLVLINKIKKKRVIHLHMIKMLLQYFQHQITVIDAAIKQPSWKLMKILNKHCKNTNKKKIKKFKKQFYHLYF
jgi:hypothetical protein